MASELETQKKAGITETASKDGKVDLTAKVNIVGNGKGNLPDGEVFEVHPILAEKLIKKGIAKKG